MMRVDMSNKQICCLLIAVVVIVVIAVLALKLNSVECEYVCSHLGKASGDYYKYYPQVDDVLSSLMKDCSPEYTVYRYGVKFNGDPYPINSEYRIIGCPCAIDYTMCKETEKYLDCVEREAIFFVDYDEWLLFRSEK